MPVYVIGAFIIFLGLIIYLLINRHRMIIELSTAYFLLGYYKTRFGEVSLEDIVSGVGIPEEFIDRK